MFVEEWYYQKLIREERELEEAIDEYVRRTGGFITMPVVTVPFRTVTSEKFEKTEQELLAYSMPITKIIENNSVKDLSTVIDNEAKEFLRDWIEARLWPTGR